MIVLAVNIRSGGSRTTVDALVDRCVSHDPAVAVLSEYRDTPMGAAIRERFARAGYEEQAWTRGHRGNGVLIAARSPFTAVENPFGLTDAEYPNAMLLARLGSLDVFGVYLPGQDRKRPHLRCLIAAAQRYNERGARALCIGDFNSGRNDDDIEINARSGRLVDAFSTADLYAQLEQRWTEAWLHLHPGKREYSWRPFRREISDTAANGWRIDKAFVSQPLLHDVQAAYYDHGFRESKLTDHSGLIVQLGSTQNTSRVPAGGQAFTAMTANP